MADPAAIVADGTQRQRGAVAITDVALHAVWALRGDADAPALPAEVDRRFGAGLPRRAGGTARSGAATILATGPDAWLVVCAQARDDFDAARLAFRAAGGALFDVSASYLGWRVAGERAAQVLNRLCPLDLDPRVFAPGGCAQSVLGQIGALIHRPDEAPAFVVLVARSFADDALHALREAAAPEA